MKFITKPIVVFAVVLFLCAEGFAIAPQLAAVIGKCENAYKRKPIVSAAVIDLRNGKFVYDYNADLQSTPASNHKLLAGIFALERLGKDFQYTTGVYYTPSGDLLLVGGFDPLLGDPVTSEQLGKDVYWQLDLWADKLKSFLNGRVVGDILVAVDKETPTGRHPDWPARQNSRSYQVPVSRLNFHCNTYGVVFDNAAGSIVPRLIPYSRFIKFSGSVKRGKKHIWSLRPGGDGELLNISGTVTRATAKPLYTACDRPALLLGRTLAERLLRAKVDFTGTIKEIDFREVKIRGKCVARTSNSLVSVLRRANKNSLNIAADCMMLRAGNGRWDGSARLLEKVLTRRFHLPYDSITCRDGSGLSRKNKVTAAAMAKLLAGVADKPYFSEFLDSLSISGVDGTIRKRMKEDSALGRVHAKTGYILGVSALSGYILDPQHKPRYAFSFIVNKIPGSIAKAKIMQNNLCRELIKQTQ